MHLMHLQLESCKSGMTTLIKLKYVITVDNNHDIKIGMIANIVLIIL